MYIELKDYSRAIKNTKSILEKDPNNIKALYRQAVAECEDGLFEDAIVQLLLIN